MAMVMKQKNMAYFTGTTKQFWGIHDGGGDIVQRWIYHGAMHKPWG